MKQSSTATISSDTSTRRNQTAWRPTRIVDAAFLESMAQLEALPLRKSSGRQEAQWQTQSSNASPGTIRSVWCFRTTRISSVGERIFRTLSNLRERLGIAELATQNHIQLSSRSHVLGEDGRAEAVARAWSCLGRLSRRNHCPMMAACFTPSRESCLSLSKERVFVAP